MEEEEEEEVGGGGEVAVVAAVVQGAAAHLFLSRPLKVDIFWHGCWPLDHYIFLLKKFYASCAK